MRNIGLIVVVTIAILAVVVACGGGEEGPEPTVTPSPTPTVVPTPTVAPTPTFVPDTPVGTVEASVPAGKIVFISRRTGDYEIFLLTPDGEVRLTNNPAEDENPDLSPDGEKIVFASNREEGVYHIYVMNVDGSGLTKLTDAQAGDLSSRWSPDGKHIAFTRTGAIHVMNSDGSNVQQITEPEPEATAAPCKAGAFLGDWSPDGERIVFYAASVTRGLGQICTVKVDGSDLTVVASEPEGWHVEPTWSPDGEWIAYRFIGRDENHEIYKVRPDGTDRTNLTNHPAMDIEPGWSFDGEWIVFGSSRTGNFDLYMMRPDGSDVARLTNSSGKDSDPAWGP